MKTLKDVATLISDLKLNAKPFTVDSIYYCEDEQATINDGSIFIIDNLVFELTVVTNADDTKALYDVITVSLSEDESATDLSNLTYFAESEFYQTVDYRCDANTGLDVVLSLVAALHKEKMKR